MREERGSMLPLLGGLVFASLVIVSLAVDVALLHGAYVEVGLLADVAAESGAAMIDEAQAHDERLVIDADRARRAAHGVLAGGSERMEAVIEGASLCVTVTREHRTVALGLVGVAAVDVRVRSCAEPVTG
jgi:hypothetical protein